MEHLIHINHSGFGAKRLMDEHACDCVKPGQIDRPAGQRTPRTRSI
jgi:hypothetical protein